MNLKAQEEKQFKSENQRVAKRMQKLIKNKEEISECLYRYRGPIMTKDNCMLIPGDYMVKDKDTTITPRGVQLDLGPDEISYFIDNGTLEKVFDNSGLDFMNDFDEKIEDIIREMHLQSTYQDANVYYIDNNKDASLAGYISEQNPDIAIAAVQRTGQKFRIRQAINIVTSMPDAIQCDYEHFNPYMLDIQTELKKTINPERQNKTIKFEALKKAYNDNNYESINNNKSALERIKDMKKQAEADDNHDKVNEIETISPLMSRMSKYM